MTYISKYAPRRKPMGDSGEDVGAWLSQFFFGVTPADKANPTDQVNQTAGGGSTSAADFVSVAGACKPRNFPTLAQVQFFQRQLNRLADKLAGMHKVTVDGAIGPDTLAMFRIAQSAAGGSIMGDASSCMNVAADVDVLGQQIRDFADSRGAAPQVSDPVSLKPTTIVTKSGQTVVPPNPGAAGALASLSPVEKMALLGVGGGIVYLLATKRKRRK